MSDPRAVLAEYGMPVPDDMDVNVVENTDTTVHITMPAPPSGAGGAVRLLARFRGWCE